MEIRKALTTEYDKLVKLYIDMIEEMPRFGMAVGWIMGVYPTYEFLSEQLSLGNCFVADDNGNFVGAMIINTLYNEGYDRVKWPVEASSGEFASLHLLGVLPQYHHQGIGIGLTNKAIEIAKAQGLKALRLDVIDGNNPARKLYEKCGFYHVEDINLYYDDCGLVNFYLYEYPLE